MFFFCHCLTNEKSGLNNLLIKIVDPINNVNGTGPPKNENDVSTIVRREKFTKINQTNDENQ